MRLPYLQVAMEVMELAAPDLAVELDRPEGELGWGLLKVFKWALGRCPDNAPPSWNDVVKGPAAARLIAAAAGYGGDPDAYVGALCSVSPDPLLERVEGGIRICGLNRYDQAWLKNQTDEVARKWRTLLAKGKPGPVEAESRPVRNRAGTDTEPGHQTQTQTQTQKETKEEEAGADAPPSAADEAGFQRLWNETAHPSLPRWQAMPKGRKTAARARIREHPWAYWVQVIQRINASSFCLGENNRGWRANPDFLLRPDTAAKVLEGAYDDKPQGRSIDQHPDMPRCHVEGCHRAGEAEDGAGNRWCYPHLATEMTKGSAA
jgi:hypothetical protein